jgi:hypothetical protein
MQMTDIKRLPLRFIIEDPRSEQRGIFDPYCFMPAKTVASSGEHDCGDSLHYRCDYNIPEKDLSMVTLKINRPF